MTQDRAADRAALREKQQLLNGYLAGAAAAAMIALGDRLGLYAALRDAGACTSAELAARIGLHERWLREWLAAQAAAGVLELAPDGRFVLPPAAAEVLAEPQSLTSMAAQFDLVISRIAQLGRLPDAFRSGVGDGWDERGADAIRVMERTFGNWYRQVLVQRALPLLDGVAERLRAGGRAADVGCGAGVALLELAHAFPAAEFHGYDTSDLALARAEQNRVAAGAANVTFHQAARESLPDAPAFDLITTFDCVHDMTRPDAVAAAIRRALRPDGAWFIADIDGRETLAQNMAELPHAGLMYGISVLGCLPSAMSEPGGAGHGTLGLPEPAMRALAARAGFTRFARIDLPSPVNAYYLARP